MIKQCETGGIKMYHIKNDKRSIQSSQWIYSALEILMKEKEFNKITVSEVVEQAKVGRTTFYRSFDSIEDVLIMKCDEKFKELGEYLIQYNKSNKKEEKPPYLKPVLRFWYINSNILELIIQVNKLDIIKDSFNTTLDIFKDNLLDNKMNGDTLDYFKEIRYSILISILVVWIKNGKDIAPDYLADLIAEQLKVYINSNLLL